MNTLPLFNIDRTNTSILRYKFLKVEGRERGVKIVKNNVYENEPKIYIKRKIREKSTRNPDLSHLIFKYINLIVYLYIYIFVYRYIYRIIKYSTIILPQYWVLYHIY